MVLNHFSFIFWTNTYLPKTENCVIPMQKVIVLNHPTASNVKSIASNEARSESSLASDMSFEQITKGKKKGGWTLSPVRQQNEGRAIDRGKALALFVCVIN